MNLLETLHAKGLPKALKELDDNSLVDLASDLRAFLIDLLAEQGGHVGPNLGITEATVALHKVFDSPSDKIVWDVSHQSLPHKILTGRYELLKKFHQTGGVSPFTAPLESEHDHFIVGHTSTAISLAAGLAKARDFAAGLARSANDAQVISSADAKTRSAVGAQDDAQGNTTGEQQVKQTENIVAVMGDGSLSGGQAFEGLNIASALKSNFIVVFNDNEMSIDNNAGGLYEGLAQLRATKGESQNNIFRFLGFDYRYVEDGNDITALTKVFTEVKDIDHPIVVHIHTRKGKGLRFAEENPGSWHYHIPFDKNTGESTVKVDENRAIVVNAAQTTSEYFIKNEDTVVVIPGSPLLSPKLKPTIKERYIDVGIAEASGISFASAIASYGTQNRAIGSRENSYKSPQIVPNTNKTVKPFIAVASCFIERAYDQILQDWLVNSNPACLIVLGAGMTNSDASHIGIHDIVMLGNLPNLVYLTPTSDDEYLKMLDWCKVQNYPTAIRIPGGVIPKNAEIEGREVPDIEGHFASEIDSVEGHTVTGGVIPNREYIAKFVVEQQGSEVAFLGLGVFFERAVNSANLFKKQTGIKPTIINPRFISHLDKQLLEQLKSNHKMVVTFEDGIVEGGFGEKVARFYALSDIKVLAKGVAKEFVDSVKYGTLVERYGLEPETVVKEVRDTLEI